MAYHEKSSEPRFFVLQTAPKGPDEVFSTDVLKAKGTRRGEAARCEACGKYIGLLQWLPPYRVELETWGREFGDLAFDGGDDILVSERFKMLWDQEDLVGLSGFEPVEVVKIRRYRKVLGDPPRYFKATLARSRAAIDNEASGVECEVPATCPECRLGHIVKRWKAVILEPGTWSGEDIFLARGAGDFLVTPRFKSFCEAKAIKNAFFVPAEQSGHDFNPWEKSPDNRGS